MVSLRLGAVKKKKKNMWDVKIMKRKAEKHEEWRTAGQPVFGLITKEEDTHMHKINCCHFPVHHHVHFGRFIHDNYPG